MLCFQTSIKALNTDHDGPARRPNCTLRQTHPRSSSGQGSSKNWISTQQGARGEGGMVPCDLPLAEAARLHMSRVMIAQTTRKAVAGAPWNLVQGTRSTSRTVTIQAGCKTQRECLPSQTASAQSQRQGSCRRYFHVNLITTFARNA